MNRGAIWCAAGILAVASASYGQNARVFHGEVSDSQCALNVHSLTRSHQEMLKSKYMGGTSNTCSVYCTVSYTHLDVYKRQALSRVSGCQDMPCRLRPRRERMPMPPASGRSPTIRISSSSGKTPTPASQS